jgi:hypothetical protein
LSSIGNGMLFEVPISFVIFAPVAAFVAAMALAGSVGTLVARKKPVSR